MLHKVRCLICAKRDELPHTSFSQTHLHVVLDLGTCGMLRHVVIVAPALLFPCLVVDRSDYWGWMEWRCDFFLGVGVEGATELRNPSNVRLGSMGVSVGSCLT